MNNKLILIRHATTTAEKNTLVGKNDVELSLQGVEESQTLKKGIVEKSSNIRFFSSMLRRATQTAEIIFPEVKFRDESKCDSRLNEIDFGDWSGLDISEVIKLFPEAVEEWTRNPLGFKFPGGESVDWFIDRINDFLNSEILSRPEPAVLVCHGGVIRFIICRLLDINYSHHLAFTIHRPSLNVIDHDGKTGVLAGLNLTDLTI